MATVLKSITKIFTRKKNRKLACTMHLTDASHVHTDACFAEISPLTIIELFQSQGCESCPPALPVIHKAVDNANKTILLTYDVTYWDNAKWKDTYGRASWDARQRAYIMKWGRTGIFTPQIVVDGISDGVGARQGEVNDIIARARDSQSQQTFSVTIEGYGDEIIVKSDSAEAEAHDIVVVTYNPKSEVVKPGKGANKGKKMPYRNIVVDHQNIGVWQGGEARVAVPARDNNQLERVVLVQGQNGGPMVASYKL